MRKLIFIVELKSRLFICVFFPFLSNHIVYARFKLVHFIETSDVNNNKHNEF